MAKQKYVMQIKGFLSMSIQIVTKWNNASKLI